MIEIHFSTWYDKLKMCQKKACTVIEGLKDFMLENPLTTDAGKFAKVLAAKETKWKRELREVKESLDETAANAKGAQEISTIYSKDPVNLSTGNFIYDKEDLTSGGNPPFIFRRFYNSRNRYHGVLGADWNHNYEVSLTFKEGVCTARYARTEGALPTSIMETGSWQA